MHKLLFIKFGNVLATASSIIFSYPFLSSPSCTYVDIIKVFRGSLRRIFIFLHYIVFLFYRLMVSMNLSSYYLILSFVKCHLQLYFQLLLCLLCPTPGCIQKLLKINCFFFFPACVAHFPASWHI